jgi:hypothetical protein
MSDEGFLTDEEKQILGKGIDKFASMQPIVQGILVALVGQAIMNPKSIIKVEETGQIKDPGDRLRRIGLGYVMVAGTGENGTFGGVISGVGDIGGIAMIGEGITGWTTGHRIADVIEDLRAKAAKTVAPVVEATTEAVEGVTPGEYMPVGWEEVWIGEDAGTNPYYPKTKPSGVVEDSAKLP